MPGLLNKPNVAAASKDSTGRVNLSLQQTLLNLQANQDQISQKIGLAGFDNENQTPTNPAPARAGLKVSVPTAGNVAVLLTNPEYLNPKLNPLRTPLIHEVSYSTNPTFAVAGTVTTLPPTTQAHFSLPLSGTYYVRVRSSVDGVNWNKPQISKAVTA